MCKHSHIQYMIATLNKCIGEFLNPMDPSWNMNSTQFKKLTQLAECYGDMIRQTVNNIANPIWKFLGDEFDPFRAFCRSSSPWCGCQCPRCLAKHKETFKVRYNCRTCWHALKASLDIVFTLRCSGGEHYLHFPPVGLVNGNVTFAHCDAL